MAFLDNITRKVTETAKTAAKKSGELVEITKINMAISSEEEKINKICLQIGKDVYEAFTEGRSIPGFEEKCLEIKDAKESIQQLKEKILTLRGVKICSGCGIEMERQVVFCSKCGTKNEITSEMEAQPAVDTGKKLCPACGAEVGEGAAFCGSCGKKLG